AKSSSSIDQISVLSDLKEDLQGNFMEVIKAVQGGLVFIDNVQLIDQKSLELLQKVMSRYKLAVVCAGCFEEAATWNTMWKISLIPQVRIVNVEALQSKDIPYLMCCFLHVKGIDKKLVVLINKTCEGRPGWVQAFLLKMINNGELEVKYALTSEPDY